MRTQKIKFPDQEVLCVFPSERSELIQAISELRLNNSYPVIVLIGGDIGDQQAEATRRAIQTIAGVADNLSALVICGGTDMGVMAEMGQIRWKSGYAFPLIGIAPEELVTWTDGPHTTKFLWWENSVGNWNLITPISSSYLAASLAMSLPGYSIPQPYYPKIIDL